MTNKQGYNKVDISKFNRYGLRSWLQIM